MPILVDQVLLLKDLGPWVIACDILGNPDPLSSSKSLGRPNRKHKVGPLRGPHLGGGKPLTLFLLGRTSLLNLDNRFDSPKGK